MTMNDAIIRDILRVNHGGEHGAIRIYAAQIAAARRIAPDIVPQLEAALADERRHCATCRSGIARARASEVATCCHFGAWAELFSVF